MPSAINLRDHSVQQAKRTKDARRRARNARRGAKAFESLSPRERNELLKELAVRAGLIADSDDV